LRTFYVRFRHMEASGSDAAARLACSRRTLDAIHVASAQVLRDSLDTLFTCDKRMLDVARAAGLPAEAPALF
jgi:hypothetical protein